jgi:Ca2+-binding EF-hand superfamily protein
MEIESLIQELDQAIRADNAFYSERVAIDQLAFKLEPGSDRALSNSSTALTIKRKQQLIQTSVIDTLKFGLEQKLDQEDERLLSIASFSNDDPSFNTLQMFKISCSLLETYKQPHHSSIRLIYPIIMSQPWLIEGAIDDAHLEEQLLEDEIELDSMQKELTRFKLMKEDGEKKARDLKEKILELESEVKANEEAPVDDENPDEREERLTLLAMMQTEMTNKSMELEMTIQMNEQMETSMLPSAQKIQDVTDSIFIKKEKIDANIIERSRLSEAYFRFEFKIVESLQDCIAIDNSVVDRLISKVSDRLRVHKTFCPPESYINQERLYRPLISLELEALSRPVTRSTAEMISNITSGLEHMTRMGTSDVKGKGQSGKESTTSNSPTNSRSVTPTSMLALERVGDDNKNTDDTLGNSGTTKRGSISIDSFKRSSIAVPSGGVPTIGDASNKGRLDSSFLGSIMQRKESPLPGEIDLEALVGVSNSTKRRGSTINARTGSSKSLLPTPSSSLQNFAFADHSGKDGATDSGEDDSEHSGPNDRTKTLVKHKEANQINIEKAIHDPEQLSVFELEALNMPLGSTWIQQYEAHCDVSRRANIVTLDYIYLLEYELHKAKSIGLGGLRHQKNILKEESTFVTEIRDAKRLKVYNDRVALLEKYMLRQRRQRSLQHNIDLRKRRIEELRQVRLRAMLEQKQKQEEEVAAKIEAKKTKRAAEIPIGEQLKRGMKAAFKGAKKLVREVMTAKRELDPEEQRMMHRISGHLEADNRPEGIRYVAFTYGPKGEELFQKQNDYIKEQGLPYYVKYKRQLGFGLSIWTQSSHEAKSFITHFELAPRSSLTVKGGITDAAALTRPDTAEMKAKTSMGEQINYKAMGFEAIDPGPKFNLICWIKRDKGKIKAIGNIGLSLSIEDENILLDEGYVKYEKNLTEFDLPEAHVWLKKIDKIVSNVHSTTGSVINELVKTRELYISNPQDKNLASLLDRHKQKLEEHYLEEQKQNVTNPITAAIDLMVLSPQDLNNWANVFESIDENKEGFLDINQIFSFLEETPTDTSIEIFRYVDAFDEDEQIEFGDFMRAIGTYCMFGKDELLRFLFTYMDKLSEGTITHAQFINLINIVNPFDKKRCKRALAEMALRADKTISYYEFYQINANFPALFHPMFKLQHTMRTKLMGENWWVAKLRKYKGVRDRVGGDVDVDRLAELEKERFQKDVDRRHRMNARKREIRNEKSTVRKVLLEAKQFLDDVSMLTDAV